VKIALPIFTTKTLLSKIKANPRNFGMATHTIMDMLLSASNGGTRQKPGMPLLLWLDAPRDIAGFWQRGFSYIADYSTSTRHDIINGYGNIAEAGFFMYLNIRPGGLQYLCYMRQQLQGGNYDNLESFIPCLWRCC